MTPKWLLPSDTQTFQTQFRDVALVVQEGAYGEVYYRFAVPKPEALPQTLSHDTRSHDTLSPLVEAPLVAEH